MVRVSHIIGIIILGLWLVSIFSIWSIGAKVMAIISIVLWIGSLILFVKLVQKRHT